MRILLIFAAATAVFGQSPAFEVASIKAAPPPDGHGITVGSKGGPGTPDPGRWTCENFSLSDLIGFAYDLKRHEYSGPAWLRDERFNINAKVPAGATKEQLREMIQNLLKERFALKFHREPKEMQGYELVVAKNGPKLQESAPPKSSDPDAAGAFKGGSPRFTLGADGFPTLPPGQPMMIMMNGKAKRQALGETMEAFARMLGNQLNKPVVDATGLAGKYDFTLAWTVESMSAAPSHAVGDGGPLPVSDPGGPTLFSALQEQLGLKLEPKKTTARMLVVDSVEKTPTEN